MAKFLGLLSAFLLYSYSAWANNFDDQKITDALKYAKSNDWQKAYALAASSSSPGLAVSLVKFKEIIEEKETLELSIDFYQKNKWFPICGFQNKIEKKISSGTNPESIIKWFKICTPKSESAKLLEDYASISLKKTSIDNSFLAHWASVNEINPSIDQLIFNNYKKQISPSLIIKKSQNFIWHSNYNQALYYSKFLPPSEQRLNKLRISYADNLSGYNMLTKKYPSLKNDEYIQYKHIMRLLKERKDDEAYTAFLSVKHFSVPIKWWKAKNVITRNLIREKQYRKAYKIAISHGTKTGDEYQDAEWIAGWISLRFLSDPKTAAHHFFRSYIDCQYASCKSRAAYWLARSYKKLNDQENTSAWYNTAAKHKLHFYGSLAKFEQSQSISSNKLFDYTSEKPLKITSLDSDTQKTLQAAYYMTKSGNHNIAKVLSRQIAQNNSDPKVKYAFANYLNGKCLTPARIEYVKFLANHQGPFLKCGYPTDILISNNKNSKALYLAIIRQESNFDQYARSPAGAIGLMQLIPSTAKRFAKILGLHYNAFKHDPKANVIKGVTYLDHLVSYFGSIIPAIAAYNAGENAVDRWINEFGNPTKMQDIYMVLDWIESIPYAETRTYVKKVLENMMVYENILRPNNPILLVNLLGK